MKQKVEEDFDQDFDIEKKDNHTLGDYMESVAEMLIFI